VKNIAADFMFIGREKDFRVDVSVSKFYIRKCNGNKPTGVIE